MHDFMKKYLFYEHFVLTDYNKEYFKRIKSIENYTEILDLKINYLKNKRENKIKK